MSKQWNSC